MANRRRIEAGVFPLPEVLIQHIQSFLDGKGAAQTSILSKSWYRAWSTRPNLEFDQRHFEMRLRHRGNEERFWNFAEKTIQRYEALELRIQSFRLWVQYLSRSNYYLVEQLIVKAIKMGALDFNFEISNCSMEFSLPLEVLGSQTLIRLSVNGCKIVPRPDRKVNCRKLKSLCFKRIRLEGDVICDLISSCPLIEKLRLESITVQHSVVPDTTYGLGSVLHGLYKLDSLFLSHVNVDNLFFSTLSSNFPCLKNLSLDSCKGYNCKGIKISSRTLECISFLEARLLQAKFDFPSIRKFEFSGTSWPSLTFETASREWESDIHVGCNSSSTGWFLKLKKLVTSLRSSKISISFSIWSIREKSVNFRGLPETAVENLTIRVPPSVLFTVLEGLFRSCRPKFITVHLLPDFGTSGKVKNDFLEIVSKKNVEGIRENCLMMNPELEEVDVELLPENFEEKWHLPDEIHFRLRWRGGGG